MSGFYVGDEVGWVPFEDGGWSRAKDGDEVLSPSEEIDVMFSKELILVAERVVRVLAYVGGEEPLRRYRPDGVRRGPMLLAPWPVEELRELDPVALVAPRLVETGVGEGGPRFSVPEGAKMVLDRARVWSVCSWPVHLRVKGAEGFRRWMRW